MNNLNHPEYAHCTPYVNLNGNSRKQLVGNCYAIIEAIGAAMDKIARADFNHGRNAMDKEHDRQLKDAITEDITSLRELSTKYHAILDNLLMNSEGEFYRL